MKKKDLIAFLCKLNSILIASTSAHNRTTNFRATQQSVMREWANFHSFSAFNTAAKFEKISFLSSQQEDGQMKNFNNFTGERE